MKYFKLLIALFIFNNCLSQSITFQDNYETIPITLSSSTTINAKPSFSGTFPYSFTTYKIFWVTNKANDLPGYINNIGSNCPSTPFWVLIDESKLQTLYFNSANTLNPPASSYTSNGWFTDIGGGGSNLNLSGTGTQPPPPTITSVSVPSNGTYIAGQNLNFIVNFSAVVTINTGGGSPFIPITLNTGGTVNASYVSGSGTSAITFRYTVASGNADPDGISIGSSISLNGGTIKDAATNNAILTLNNVGSSTSVLVDAIAPYVSSINRFSASPNKATSDQFTVTFSESVTGVDASDFTIVTTGTVASTGINVSGSASVYNVTINGVNGNGTLGLNLNSSGTGITDVAGNAISGGLTGQTYTVDQITQSPSISSPTTSGSYNGQSLAVSLNVPEAPLTNTITLTFQGLSNTAVITLNNATGSITGNLITNNLATSSIVASSTVSQLQPDIYTITLTYQDALGNPATSISISNFSFNMNPTWTGTTSTNWAIATNWNTSSVPISTSNVTIPNVANLPVIASANNAVLNNLTINSGASLTVSGTLTPSGIITNNGTLIIASGGALVGSSANVTGTVTLQQSVVAQRGWRIFANPFSSAQTIATVASNNGITIGTTVPTSGITDSRTYSNSSGTWSNVTASTWASDVLYGLFIRGLSSEVTGTTYTGGPSAFTYNVSGNLLGNSVNRSQTNGVFRICANPYAAPVKTSALTAQTANVPYYTYKISATGTPRVKSGSWIASGTNSSTSTTIPVMGALCYMPTSSTGFTITTSDINTTGTLQTGLFGTESTIQQLEIIVNKESDFADKLFIRTDATATNNGKDRTDLPKFENETTNFYTIAPDNSHLAVDTRKEWNQNIPLGINSGVGNYSIAIENNSLPSGTNVYLKDKLLNSQTELKAGANYSFTITADTATQGEKRFELIFTKPATSLTAIETQLASGLQMKVLGNIVSGNVLSIQVNGLKVEETGILSVIDMNGRLIATKSVTNGLNTINISNASKGMQLIQLSNSKNQLTQKFIKE